MPVQHRVIAASVVEFRADAHGREAEFLDDPDALAVSFVIADGDGIRPTCTKGVADRGSRCLDGKTLPQMSLRASVSGFKHAGRILVLMQPGGDSECAGIAAKAPEDRAGIGQLAYDIQHGIQRLLRVISPAHPEP